MAGRWDGCGKAKFFSLQLVIFVEAISLGVKFSDVKSLSPLSKC